MSLSETSWTIHDGGKGREGEFESGISGLADEAKTNLEKRADYLVNTYSDMILRLCWTYLHSTQDAEDVCQETLLKILTSHVEFSSPEHEKAWIIRTTSNACKDLLKSSRYAKTVELDQSFDVADERDEIEELTNDVYSSVDELPMRYREAIYLRYYEGYSSKEIADLTGQTIAAVDKQLSRARKLLRAQLESEYA